MNLGSCNTAEEAALVRARYKRDPVAGETARQQRLAAKAAVVKERERLLREAQAARAAARQAAREAAAKAAAKRKEAAGQQASSRQEAGGQLQGSSQAASGKQRAGKQT